MAENPWAEVLSIRTWKRKGTIAQARTKLWRVINMFEAGLNAAAQEERGDDLLRYGHAMQQVTNTYAKLVRDHEFEERLKALENASNTV